MAAHLSRPTNSRAPPRRPRARRNTRLRTLATLVDQSASAFHQNFTSQAYAELGIPVGSLGSTPQGEAWALRALHPNTDQPLEPEGIPDTTDVKAAEPGYFAEATVQGGVGLQDTWDACIVALPIDGNPLIYAFGPAGTDFTEAAAWTDLTTGNVNPPSRSNPGPNDLSFGFQNFDAVRTTYKGVTVDLDAPSLSDQGWIYAWQGARHNQPTRIVNQSGAHTQVDFHIPLTETELIALDRGTYRGRAKDGAYVPLRFVNPVHEWQSTDYPRRAPDGSSAGNILAYTIKSPDGTSAIFANPTDPVQGSDRYASSHVDNTQTGVIIVRGISGAAKLRLKLCFGEEQACKSTSPLAATMSPSPLVDSRAMKRVAMIQHHLPLAYPADHNSLGGILSVIGKVASGITGMLQNVPGPTGMIAGLAHGVLAPLTAGDRRGAASGALRAASAGVNYAAGRLTPSRR